MLQQTGHATDVQVSAPCPRGPKGEGLFDHLPCCLRIPLAPSASYGLMGVVGRARIDS
jgi:hypothetical protein